ncbi:MAG: TetM/TetW/TetO/TetS family tetracycline resistance ribosomal protection protein [Clostridia bacterium]|nr:TetM/TetW/TetO/TetS family tetracycline resistance ribosomal protection protein [Clostridia bacterium]
MKKKLTIGILAHVDAGKTTLSEALLYVSGKIRKQGRVDHGNTYLDTNAVERERGITVFSKQARFSYGECDFILLDTPGHVDFSAETERTLALLDYAVLLVSAPDGVQNHTRTLWNLLEFYGVPTFIFVNKNDICIKTKKELETELCRALSPACTAFFENQTKAELDEKLALTDEALLESFLAEEPIGEGEIAELVAERKLFPCLFGSALRNTGVEFLLETLEKYTLAPVYGEQFGAKVYKIAHAGGTRLTYMKITGGKLCARDEIAYTAQNGEKKAEKASLLRLYSGEKFEQVDSAVAGEICAVAGLSATYAGLGLGAESDAEKPVLAPVLSYRIVLPAGCDTGVYFMKFKELEEEEPSLHLRINEELGEIEAELMGEIGVELLSRLISERFGIKCEFDEGKILYKEKISGRAIGIGHFEPLRHYAEVQLLLEPLPSGMGLIIDANVPENSLEKNWQRLILSHLYEKSHRGTLIGAELTDTKITLVAGKAHQKHTEGGDFREATFRAVRCGLMRAGCTLLEPYYKFRLEVPSENVGRAMADLQARSAEFAPEEADGEFITLCGRAPVSALRGYMKEVIAYTRGKGKLSCTSDGYEPCGNEAEVAAEFAYDPEADVENTPHSVFCAGGAGFIVPWQDVEEYKHLDANYALAPEGQTVMPKPAVIAKKYRIDEDELEKIMFRLFGDGSPRKAGGKRVVSAGKAEKPKKKAAKPLRHMIIVDGYNVIYAWESLKNIAAVNLDDARKTLMDILSNYVAFTKKELVLVFDAYRVKDGRGSDFSHDGFRVVFTKQEETADAYIEKMMHDLGPDYSIRTVTGDRLVQFAAVHSGVLRMTPKEFEAEVTRVGAEINDFLKKLEEK